MQIVLKHCVKYTLDRNCQLKPLAYLNACVNGTSAGGINFDTDAKAVSYTHLRAHET